MSADGGPRTAGALERAVPALGWLRKYDIGWLRADVVAGVTLAAYMLPAGIGDASLANLPPQAGIYACLFSGLVFWLFCSSRHTAVTVTSAISLLIGSSLGTLAGGDATRFATLAAMTALLVAGLALVAWLIRAGAIVNFVSETVLDGWKSGVALFLASTQLPKLFGFKGSHGDFWERSGHFLSHLGETDAAALGIGLAALTLLVLGKILWKNRPIALFVVIGGIAAAPLFDLAARGVSLLGEVPRGLPAPGLPGALWSDINELLPLAMACFIIGAVETAAIGRMFAAKHGGKLDPNQEFLALAGANLASGLGHGFPVSGGMSQSLVNESSGARTPVSGLVASSLILMVTLFLTGLLRNLPQPVLAAIVLVAVAGLFKLSALRHLWRASRSEFLVAIAALAGVLGSGLLRGVMIGAVLSLVQLLRRASRPHVAFLGRIPGTRRFSDMERNPDNEAIPGVLIFRPESSLVYFNIDHIRESVMERVRSAGTVPGLVVCDLTSSPHVDLQSANALKGLAADLEAMGSQLQLVEARASVRDTLRAEGLEKEGTGHRWKSVADLVDDYKRPGATSTVPSA